MIGRRPNRSDTAPATSAPRNCPKNADDNTQPDDGKVIIESSLILYYIDDAFPDPPLMPKTPAARHVASAACRWASGRDPAPHTVPGIARLMKVSVLWPEPCRRARGRACPSPRVVAAG